MKKVSRETIVAIAYDLQNALTEITHKRPIRITTNREHSILRVVWPDKYEKKEWYNVTGVRIVLEAFEHKYGIHIRELAKSQEKKSAVWLTKKENDPSRRQ